VRTVLVHDWLTGMRGGERVLEVLAERWPDAPIHTLFHVPGAVSPALEAHPIATSPLSRWPGAGRTYRALLPLHPLAVRRLRLPAADLVVSTHHAVAKAVPLPPGAAHLCYCFTPMRYVWDQADAYLGTGLRRRLAAPVTAALRRFDRATAGPEQVHRFVATSRAVADRVRRHYRRRCAVLAPPVDIERFRPDGAPPDDFYLLVGGFVPYKRDDLAIEAFRQLDRPLVVAGDGPGRARLEAEAPKNVRFVGRVDDAGLASLYARCRALVYPQEEDFGLVAVEAQAAGRPVIAYAAGGALDTVCSGAEPDGTATGVFFADATPADLAAAVRRFEALEGRFDPGAIRAWAEGFGTERFRRAFEREVEATLDAFCARSDAG